MFRTEKVDYDGQLVDQFGKELESDEGEDLFGDED